MAEASSDISVKPHFWDEASRYLMRRDRILRRLIPQHDSEWLFTSGTHFMTLARAIVGQQVSTKAADTIWRRVLKHCGQRPSPHGVLKVPAEQLRELGLSRRKCEYIHDLARHFIEEKFAPESWSEKEDEEIITELRAVRGVGRWTAEMFLMFSLQRPNVLPLDDAGLLRAISQHYFSGEPVSRFEAREVAQAWVPWCTVATWYLWRSLEAQPVKN
ncbi:MAG TPA: DNA-3-methyladenine glycosylase 2 family protein [Burkholderiaceae bacterium]|nr:DNA-3-methyladenine glycosylase 2 family protein [Burkholderiaceae bacterium]